MTTRIGQSLPTLPAPIRDQTVTENGDPIRYRAFDTNGDGKADAFMTTRQKVDLVNGAARVREHTGVSFFDDGGRPVETLSAIDNVVRSDERITWNADGQTGVSLSDSDGHETGRSDFRNVVSVFLSAPWGKAAERLGLPNGVTYTYGPYRSLEDVNGDGTWDKRKGLRTVDASFLDAP